MTVLALLVLGPLVLVPPLFYPALSDHELGTLDTKERLAARNDRFKLQNDLRNTLLQALGGMAVLVGAYYAAQQLFTAREGQVTERFTRAVDQLGSRKLDVRLGGIYALERIAHDSPRDRATIEEVLTAFVRGHAPWPPPPRTAGRSEPLGSLRERAADVQAAMDVLGRRPLPPDGGQRLALSRVDLRKAELVEVQLKDADLMEAQLEGAVLLDAHLEGAQLNRTHLEGALLRGVHLEGASLMDAQLEGARLGGTHLEGAWLHNAHLEGAQLFNAHLEGAQLRGAHLERAWLMDAHLEGADLRGADSRGADLRGADFRGADLRGAHFDGVALREAYLRGAHYSRDTLPADFDWKAATGNAPEPQSALRL